MLVVRFPNGSPSIRIFNSLISMRQEDSMATNNAGIGEGKRSGRHFSGQPEKRIRIAGPLVREILEKAGHVGKANRSEKGRGLSSRVSAQPEESHELSGVISVLLVDDH